MHPKRHAIGKGRRTTERDGGGYLKKKKQRESILGGVLIYRFPLVRALSKIRR